MPFAALTFVSVGTIHFWQGWLFWLSLGGVPGLRRLPPRRPLSIDPARLVASPRMAGYRASFRIDFRRRGLCDE